MLLVMRSEKVNAGAELLSSRDLEAPVHSRDGAYATKYLEVICCTHDSRALLDSKVFSVGCL